MFPIYNRQTVIVLEALQNNEYFDSYYVDA